MVYSLNYDGERLSTGRGRRMGESIYSSVLIIPMSFGERFSRNGGG